MTRPDAVVQPVRRRRPDQRQRGRGDVVDMARRHDPVHERPDLAPGEQRAGDAVEAAPGPASVGARPIHAAEQALDAQIAAAARASDRTPNALTSSAAAASSSASSTAL